MSAIDPNPVRSVFQAAVSMRSLDSSESRRPRARETTTTKGAAALTVSWATAGETTDRRRAGAPRRPQTLEAHTPTSERCRLVVCGGWGGV